MCGVLVNQAYYFSSLPLRGSPALLPGMGTPPLLLVLKVNVEHHVALQAFVDLCDLPFHPLILNSQSHRARTEIHTFFALDDIVLAIKLSR